MVIMNGIKEKAKFTGIHARDSRGHENTGGV